MPRSIDEAAQNRRRRDALQSAIIATACVSISAGVKLVLYWYFQLHGFLGAVLVILSALELGMNLPIWILFKERIKEIEGGEEDAAAQY